MSGMKKAMQDAGFRDFVAEVTALALTAARRHPDNRATAHEQLVAAIWADLDMARSLYALFDQAVTRKPLDQAYQALAQERRPASAKAPAKLTLEESQRRAHEASRAGREAAAARDRQSWLDRFMVNGRPIGTVTVREAAGWATTRSIEARFVRLLIHGMPEDGVIGRYATAEDADRVMALARQQEQDSASWRC